MLPPNCSRSCARCCMCYRFVSFYPNCLPDFYSFYLLYLALNALDTHALEKIQAILRAVVVAIYHALDTRLNDELRTLDAGRSAYGWSVIPTAAGWLSAERRRLSAGRLSAGRRWLPARAVCPAVAACTCRNNPCAAG